MKRVLTVAVALVLLPGLAAADYGDILFESEMDSGDVWTTYADPDCTYTWGWDFTSMGIPASPTGSTTGLYMAANLTGSDSYLAVHATPTDFSASGQYQVEFDMWINVAHVGGTTEFGGGGVGFNPEPGFETWQHGASLIVDGEGGSSYDYRLYKDDGLQYPGSAQYAAGTYAGANNNTDPYYSGFVGQAAPQYQQDNFGAPATPLADGTIGFGWHHMTIMVDPDAIGAGINPDTPGVAEFYLDGLLIGGIDNTNGGNVVDMTGGVEVYYMDIFGSQADPTDLAFGVFDNFVVTEIPEPGCVLLLVLGGLVMRRR